MTDRSVSGEAGDRHPDRSFNCVPRSIFVGQTIPFSDIFPPLARVLEGKCAIGEMLPSKMRAIGRPSSHSSAEQASA